MIGPAPTPFAPMCLSVPMQVIQVDGLKACCRARGAEREVSLVLVLDLDVQPGDMVSVHQGCALDRIPAESRPAGLGAVRRDAGARGRPARPRVSAHGGLRRPALQYRHGDVICS
jgi:hydrogenase expression/formation protein HypC